MNHWYQIRRLRLPAMLILVGILALLDQWHVLSFSKSWPMFLILGGILAAAERAAWSADVAEQQQPGQPYSGYPPPTAPPTWQQSAPPQQPPYDTDPEQRR